MGGWDATLQLGMHVPLWMSAADPCALPQPAVGTGPLHQPTADRHPKGSHPTIKDARHLDLFPASCPPNALAHCQVGVGTATMSTLCLTPDLPLPVPRFQHRGQQQWSLRRGAGREGQVGLGSRGQAAGRQEELLPAQTHI